jgi:protein gp37
VADNTAIEWTDTTWNPTTGCDRISPGCDNCYALKLAKRLKAMGSAKYQIDGDPRTSGPGFGLAVHPDALRLPLTWRKPRTVFVNSMSDLFHARVPADFIADVFAVMAATADRHTYQVLTKRPERTARFFAQPGLLDEVAYRAAQMCEDGDRIHDAVRYGPWPLPNVWLGTSIESDKQIGRADALRNAPAAVRFISAEPLLGPLTSLDLTGIDWLIAGGESGPGSRPAEVAWVRDLRDRCTAQGVAFFFKQWGNWVAPSQMTDETFMDFDSVHGCDAYDPDQPWRFDKKRAGRLLDGRTWDQYPRQPEAVSA